MGEFQNVIVFFVFLFSFAVTEHLLRSARRLPMVRTRFQSQVSDLSALRSVLD